MGGDTQSAFRLGLRDIMNSELEGRPQGEVDYLSKIFDRILLSGSHDAREISGASRTVGEYTPESSIDRKRDPCQLKPLLTAVLPNIERFMMPV
jgi:hypothetical protein